MPPWQSSIPSTSQVSYGLGDKATRSPSTSSCRSFTTDCERRRAASCGGSTAGGLLQTTALVHEVYLRLIGTQEVSWHDRVHFFALSAQIMRRILVDAARARTAAKRGGRGVRPEHSSAVDLDQIPTIDSSASSLCALDDALEELSRIDPRRARVIELRFFGGLSVEETAEVLAVSPQTVMRDWRLARAWLARELRSDT